MSLQQVGVELLLEDDQYKRRLHSADMEAQNWARRVSTTFQQVANVGQNVFFLINGFQTAFNLVSSIFDKPISASSDFEETLSKFNVVFGDNAVEVRKWAQEYGDAASGVGRAETELLSMLSTLQDTFVPLGFSRAEAAELSKTLTALAVDVASFNNKLDAEVIADFQSALVGNHETVRKYGIVITEETLKREALNSKIIETKRELTAAEKVQARLNLITKGTTDAQGDAIRTAESYANTSKRLGAVVTDTVTILGDRFTPTAGRAKSGLIDLLYTVQDLIKVPLEDKIRAEMIEFNSLAQAVADANTPAGVRAELIDELQGKFGKYLGDLDLEKASYDEIKGAIEQVNAQLEKKIKIAALEEELSGSMRTQVQIQKEINEQSRIASQADENARGALSKKIATGWASVQLQESQRKAAIEYLDGVGESTEGLANNTFQVVNERLESYANRQKGLATEARNGIRGLNTDLQETRNQYQQLYDELQFIKPPDIEPPETKSGAAGDETRKKTDNQKKLEWEYTEWLREQEEERLKNLEKIKEEEKAFLIQVDEEQAERRRDIAERELSERRDQLQELQGLAVDIGQAMTTGFHYEGLRGALKQALIVYLSYLEKLVLASKVEAGIKTLSGDFLALGKLAGIVVAFETAKASILNFAEGGIVRASQGGTLARIGEAGRDEAVIPLGADNDPLQNLLAEIQGLRSDMRNAPPQILGTKIKGTDLELVLEKVGRGKF